MLLLTEGLTVLHKNHVNVFLVTAMFECWRIVFRKPFMSTTSLQLIQISEYTFSLILRVLAASSVKSRHILSLKAYSNGLFGCLCEMDGPKSYC